MTTRRIVYRVPCSGCQAVVGEPCRPLGTFTHIERLNAEIALDAARAEDLRATYGPPESDVDSVQLALMPRAPLHRQ